MKKRWIIGIVGKNYHGKDAIADMIVRKYDYQKISFANPLKEGCRHIFGLSDEQLYGDKKDLVDEYYRVTSRALLQFVGTDLFRNQIIDIIPHIGNTLWIRRLEKTLLNNPHTNYVISDIRFQNELDMLKNHGAIVLKVYRPNILHRDEHISEKGIDDIVGFDELVLNDGTIDELYNKVTHILDVIPM